MSEPTLRDALSAIAAAGTLNPDLKKPRNALYGTPIALADLETLTEQALVAREAVSYAPCCPGCDGLALLLNGSCPDCFNHALTTTPLVHHIPCAGVFEAPDGVAAVTDCPKCLRSVAPEHDSLEPVGEMHRCDACAARFPEPVIRLYCHNCDTNHALHDLRFHPIHRYQLTPAGEAALRDRHHE